MSVSNNFGVFVIILNLQGQVLGGERLGGYGSGYWGMPGGQIEPGEKILAAAQRELLEETGLELKVSDLSVLGCVRDVQNNQNFTHFVVLAKPAEYQPRLIEPNKCLGWEWRTRENFPELVVPGHIAGWQLWQTGEPVIEIESNI